MWNKLSMENKSHIINMAVKNGITDLNAIRNIYNKYGEGGGIGDTWKPWYWNTPTYEGETLKDALYKAYDDGLEGKNILYNNKAYKVALSDSDLKEYNTKKQHEANRKITNEQVVDSYIDNVLYTMENPTNKGYKNNKYYPYADISSPKNLGPGINYTSNMAKEFEYSDSKGYTRKEINNKIRPYLIEGMDAIMKDLHDLHGKDADTLSLGNRMIFLDVFHNVRPKGSKKANMPKKWPSLVRSMMEGDAEGIKQNTYSGSTRRQEMRNSLIYKNDIDQNTVKNK